MSIRFTTTARRGMAAAAVAVSLALGMAGCSSGDDKGGDMSASASKDSGSTPDAQTGESEGPLAELKGQEGLLLQITAAERDSGGFLTVSGDLKNDGSEKIVPAALRGDETEIIKHGRTLGGATLVDAKEKKRYYVLRDTEGRPLTTSDLHSLKSGESIPVFMQFPAPPVSTTEVTFQLPTFAAATIKISG
ncbi:hypothetical protein ACM01_15230 [Streptomyces viridochromogenes]|uniref:Secreted protein n=1 Tax=Streptomyces viridochromogenes TaxID=1938 RepID=A0A0J7ZFS5_STRVR|nr:hypothetical protein [Streptomyces viridochromogenes]KMS74257.1 hypothetical protein ACM01_15230 [Streptomyces viridochromogenes]